MASTHTYSMQKSACSPPACLLFTVYLGSASISPAPVWLRLIDLSDRGPRHRPRHRHPPSFISQG